MKNILVVDDSKALRQHVRQILSTKGYSVEEAEDGLQGLEKLHESKFAMVICDVNMPNLNGIEFLQTIRQDESFAPFRFIPILMLTTEYGEDLKMTGHLEGAKAWVVKPFAPERLLNAVEKLCA